MIVKQSPTLPTINFFYIFYRDLFVSHGIDYELSTIDSELLAVEKYGKRCNVCDNKVDPSSAIVCVFAVADAVLRDLLAQLLTDNDDSPSHRHATKSKRDQHYSVLASAVLVAELCIEDK